MHCWAAAPVGSRPIATHNLMINFAAFWNSMLILQQGCAWVHLRPVFSTVLGPTNWLGTFWILLMRPQDFMWGPTCRMSPVSWSGLTLCGNSNAIERSKTKRAAFRGKNACSNPNFDLQCQQTCLLPLTCQNLGAAAVNGFLSVFKCFCLVTEVRRVSVSAQVSTFFFIIFFHFFLLSFFPFFLSFPT